MKSDPWLDWPSVGAVSDFKQTSFVAHKKRLLLLALHITSSSDRYHGLASNLHLSQRGLASEILLGSVMPLSTSLSPSLFLPRPLLPGAGPGSGESIPGNPSPFCEVAKTWTPLANSLPGASCCCCCRPPHFSPPTLLYHRSHENLL